MLCNFSYMISNLLSKKEKTVNCYNGNTLLWCVQLYMNDSIQFFKSIFELNNFNKQWIYTWLWTYFIDMLVFIIYRFNYQANGVFTICCKKYITIIIVN